MLKRGYDKEGLFELIEHAMECANLLYVGVSEC